MTGARRRWRAPDHFYWFTSFLAAREAQSATCRLVAVVVLTLSAMPVAAIWSPAGPQTPTARIVAIMIGAAGLGMALGWLRRRWPTRGQSKAFVVASGLCIAASCVIVADPRAGILWATTFAALGGYATLFHTARYTAVIVGLSMLTTAILAVRLAVDGDVVWAVCSAAFVIVVNIAVAMACHLMIGLLDVEAEQADIEHLTGLLNREAFYRTAGHVLSRSRDDDQQLVLLVINLDNLRLLYETDGAIAVERARVAIAQTLRENTRHNAFVAHVADDEFLIADTFSSTDSFPLVERVRSAIAATPPRVTASIGVVSTPMRGLSACPPQDLLDELIAIATAAMYKARRAGGNQARYEVCPRPSAGSTQSVEDQ